MKPVLHQFGAADMVAMGMTNDDVFDVVGIEAELLQTSDDRFVGRVFVKRIDQDNALAGGERPGRMDLGADEIKIVEHLGRLGEPGLARRSRSRRHVAPRCCLRRNANARERAGEIEARRCFRGRQVGFDSVACRRGCGT
jgi:hypothetical protein